MQLAHLKPYAGLTVLLYGAMLGGCGSTQAPQELVDARSAYTRAENSPARQFDPASLHEAKVALDKAEHSFRDDGQSQRTKDMSYVATRKAQIAEALGMTDHVRNQIADQKRAAMQQQAKTVEKDQAALDQARQQLEQERQAREAAEQRAHDALTQLTNVTKVKEEPRGTVITLPGTLLFSSGQSTLNPAAQDKLSKVADALKQQQHAKIEIQGYTDSVGNYESNLRLSQARAEAVENYLASRGVPKDAMTAKGYGPSQPIADNSTPSGRADNRRVELVVQQQQQQQRAQQ
jgi:outer membrane protein OmpA-like peptidoglycan-associated protein